MNITEEEINPLDISFSNDKGFEPSTPSQTSPPIKELTMQPNIMISNPIKLFITSPKRKSVQRMLTPPLRNIQIEVMKYSSTKKDQRRK